MSNSGISQTKKHAGTRAQQDPLTFPMYQRPAHIDDVAFVCGGISVFIIIIHSRQTAQVIVVAVTVCSCTRTNFVRRTC